MVGELESVPDTEKKSPSSCDSPPFFDPALFPAPWKREPVGVVAEGSDPEEPEPRIAPPEARLLVPPPSLALRSLAPPRLLTGD